MCSTINKSQNLIQYKRIIPLFSTKAVLTKKESFGTASFTCHVTKEIQNQDFISIVLVNERRRSLYC